jgi:hypothetical protein
LVFTGFQVTNKQVGGLASVTSFAGQSTNFDTFVDLARNGTVNWVESVTSVSGSWNKRSGVASFLFNSDHSTFFLWHESASSVDFEVVSRTVFSDENFRSFDLNGNSFVVGKFSDDFFASIGFDSFDKSSNFVVVSQSNSDLFTFSRRPPEWNGWADSPPGIGEFGDIRDLVSIRVGDIVLSVSVVRSTNTGGSEVEFSSDQQSFFVKNESGLFDQVNDDNGVVLSVDFKSGGKFNGFFGFIDTVGSSVEDESSGVALSVSKSQPTGLFTSGVDDVVAGSTVVVKTELIDVESFGRF